ncbi:MAG TPA: tRNA-specific 2-thiouridylase [Candidatus Saccharimonadales bacterium]|nr:tRNA-specific 2-thiouridylase [Candidatus Saccharimonadales bacterium]
MKSGRPSGRKVYVGLSGGVDSSVSAALLHEQGYEVVGVYMKNWSQDLPGAPCPWKEDYQDAKRVAVQLGIEFKMFDFEKQYKQKVVDYMLAEFKAGRTPNPDIMCNQEIKFKLFLDTALEDGADLIATGHYARVKHLTAVPAFGGAETPHSSRQLASSEPTFFVGGSGYGQLRDSVHPSNSSESKALRESKLFMAKDANKDQTYFLYRVSKEALTKVIFPLGELTKPEVRALAKKFGLITADKKESMGICFVGKVGIKDFLQQYVEQKPGSIIDQNGHIIGQHDGAIFYTIGQRHGLEVGGGLPYYVTGKNMKKNELYVTTDLQDENLWHSAVKLSNAHWISDRPKKPSDLMVRTRHRAKLIPVKSLQKSTRGWVAELGEDVRALTPGQSAVFYSGEQCLGGGVVV